MRLAPIRYCCQFRNASRDGLTLTLNRGLLASAPALKLVQRYKSDKKASNTDCCKEPDQAANKRVDCWPTNCELQPPPSYDPYHIKVPKVAVPSLPPSDAKPALQCSKQSAQCSGERLGPPPCPPCPPTPFDWRPLAALLTFFVLMGTIYKIYLYVDVVDPSILEAKKSWRPRKPTKVPSSWRDLPKCVQYLIIGGGQAGWSAHEAILRNDPKARIMFITKEDKLPYRLPAMSKWMWWNKDVPNPDTLTYTRDDKRETMYFKDCKYYVEPKKFPSVKFGPVVSCCKGWVVNRVDADDHIAWITTVEDDFPMYYERCLIATGSKAKTLSLFQTAAKSVRERVRTLRTVTDLEQAYRGVEYAEHVTIVGGGPLGAELAWHLGRRNELWKNERPRLGITHVIKDRGILAGVLPEYLSEWAVELVRCKGVNVVQQAQVYDAFPTPEGRIELTLSNGDSITTDYVIVAVGTQPRTEIAAASELEVDHENGGFLTNTEMRVRKHLFAAGDVASFFTQWKRRRLRCEHIENAAETGALAGTNMTGYWEPNNIEPHFKFFFEDQFTVEVIGEAGACMPTVGLFTPCAVDDATHVEPSTPEEERPCFRNKDEYRARYKRGIVFYLQEDIVTGIVFWNLPWERERLRVVKEILRAQPTVSDIDVLADLLNFEKIKCDPAPAEPVKMLWIPKKVKTTLCLKDVVRKYEKSGKPCKEYPKYACRNRSASPTPKVAKAATAVVQDEPKKAEPPLSVEEPVVVEPQPVIEDQPEEVEPERVADETPDDSPTVDEDLPDIIDIPVDIKEPETNESPVEVKENVAEQAAAV